MNIRPATRADSASIIRLVQDMAREEGELTSITSDYIVTYLDNPGSGILLALDEGQAIGLLSYSLRPDLFHAGPVALIELLFVDNNCRSLGVGSGLLKDLLGKLGEKNCVEVSVTTNLANVKAQRFYQRHGLVEESLLLEQHF